jgi:hypothetical protein
MPSAARAAKNESVFREVNERIRELGEVFGVEERASFVCECSSPGCIAAVQATLDEYQTVRAKPRRFLVARGHVNPDLERIVTQTDRYTVVEKIGLAGEIAEAEAS